MKRWLTAVVMVPPLIGVIVYLPPWCFVVMVASVATVALEEFFKLARATDIKVYRWAGHVYSVMLLASFYWDSEDQSAVFWVLTLATISFLILTLYRGHKLQDTLPSCGVTLLGIVYVSIMMGFLVAIHSQPTGQGPGWILYLLLTVWLGDTTAYYVGRRLGKRKLAPQLSPRKTWEGSIGGLLGNILAALIGQHLVPQSPMIHRLLLSCLLGIAGQAGDLAESAIKRGADAKDSSHLLPGHGGMLDRIDSVLFGAPILFCYLRLFGRL